VGDQAFDHPIEVARGDDRVEATEVGDDVLGDAAPLAPRLDDLPVLVVAAVRAQAFDPDNIALESSETNDRSVAGTTHDFCTTLSLGTSGGSLQNRILVFRQRA
jgi:hypothetical protein